jgi:hypothetical protein
MSNDHNIPPFFKRRIDHHKFEKMMRTGIPYVYYDSNNIDEFKFKLVTATLENYLHYKYNIDLETVPSEDVVSFVEYMVDTYDPLLAQYYYNMRREGRVSINENKSKLVGSFQKIVNATINNIKNICGDFDDRFLSDDISFENCDDVDTIESIEIKNVLPIKGLSNIPMFDLEVDVNFSSVFASVDYDDVFREITDQIKSKYRIFLIFTIQELNNLHDRQMEESLKTLIKNVLKEETEENNEPPLKKFLIKFWNTKRNQGEIPMIKYSFLKKLGLLKNKDEIGNYYIEYMGGKDEVLRELNNYLDGNQFTTSEIKNEGVEVGGYDFTFKIIDFKIEELMNYEQVEAFAKTKILRGTVDTIGGVRYDLVDSDSIPEDLWWEISEEASDIIRDFLYKIMYSFGLNVNDIDLEWY